MIRKNAAPEDIKPGIQAGEIKGDVSRRGPDRGRKIRAGGPWQKGKCVAATGQRCVFGDGWREVVRMKMRYACYGKMESVRCLREYRN